jgi:hypothetical protein
MSTIDQLSGSDGEVDSETSAALSGRDEITAAVARFAENRATIEQTKGMLMLVYGIDGTTAFNLLKWRSQQGNVKLRHLAEQIAAEFLSLDNGETRPPRAAYDQIVLTAHLRIEGHTLSRNGVAPFTADQDALAFTPGEAVPWAPPAAGCWTAEG